VYLLGRNETKDEQGRDLFLCSIQAGLGSGCPSVLEVIADKYLLQLNCDIGTLKKKVHPNWFQVASLALTSVGLNGGESNEAGDNERLLTTLQMYNNISNPPQPNIAEAMAALLLPTLLKATNGTLIIASSKDYNDSILPGSLNLFTASLSPYWYASGTSQKWTLIYIAEFAVAVILNFFMVYYIWIRHYRDKLFVDISEPFTLFVLGCRSKYNPLIGVDNSLYGDGSPDLAMDVVFGLDESGNLETGNLLGTSGSKRRKQDRWTARLSK
jgi:hypothetical protein